MNRRSFLATLCAVVVAPLVAVAAPTAATSTLSLHGAHLPELSVGTLLSIDNGPYSEVLRIVAVCGDGVFTVERG